MAIGVYPELEPLVKAWLSATPAAELVRRPDGGLNIFMAMPTGSPLPSIILRRIGGAPPSYSDQPVERARISMDCWAGDRALARRIAGAVAAEANALAETGGFAAGPDILYVAEVVGWIWLPDPQADTPRYIIDALFWAASQPA